MTSKWDSDPVVQRLRDYLKIPSVQPDVDYTDCVNFLKSQASSLGLPVKVYEFVPKKPVVVITWKGTEPKLPAILLNSHMDVVPVYEEHWSYPPFSAHVTQEGRIYARGSQDMKSVGMMHLEAIRRLKEEGKTLKRTVHVSFVPDEEIGGVEGMKAFAESTVFKDLNIGFALDESVANPNPNEYFVFNGERTSRQITVTCKGKPMHGSLLESGSAGEKIHFVIDKFMKLRAQEKAKLDAGAQLGDVTTINITMLRGGVQINVMPESLSVSFDIRIAPDVDLDEFENQVNKWCTEAGEGVTWEYDVKNPMIQSTKTDDSNPFWAPFVNAITNMGISVKECTCPGATDARYVRARGLPAAGLSLLQHTPILLHAHDEYLHVEEYKRGIAVMTNVVDAVANV